MKLLITTLILLLGINGFSQEDISTTKSTLPNSLYLVSSKLSFETQQNINSRLDLTSFKFVELNKKDIEDGFFSFSLKNLKRTPTAYIYDDYKYVYLDRYIFKGYDLRKLPEINNRSSNN